MMLNVGVCPLFSDHVPGTDCQTATNSAAVLDTNVMISATLMWLRRCLEIFSSYVKHHQHHKDIFCSQVEVAFLS